jgi:quinol monooxygenase YgiN
MNMETGMITITAIIRSKDGKHEELSAALREVANYVAAHEPETVCFFVSQDTTDPRIFTTYERFATEAAKNLHNGSGAVQAFFQKADMIVEQPVTLHVCREISKKV